MNLQERLLILSRRNFVGPMAYLALKVLGIELPRTVRLKGKVFLPHGAVGLVVHETTTLGDGVTLFQGVTVGRGDQYQAVTEESPTGDAAGGVTIGDGAIVSAGAKVLFKMGQTLHIGAGAIVGANAVVLHSVPAGEIWAGVPARKVGSVSAADENNSQ